jgi:hypothetical protein
MLSQTKSFADYDKLVEEKCKEHLAMRFKGKPVMSEVIYPQGIRPASSGLDGKRLKSAKLLGLSSTQTEMEIEEARKGVRVPLKSDIIIPNSDMNWTYQIPLEKGDSTQRFGLYTEMLRQKLVDDDANAFINETDFIMKRFESEISAGRGTPAMGEEIVKLQNQLKEKRIAEYQVGEYFGRAQAQEELNKMEIRLRNSYDIIENRDVKEYLEKQVDKKVLVTKYNELRNFLVNEADLDPQDYPIINQKTHYYRHQVVDAMKELADIYNGLNYVQLANFIEGDYSVEDLKLIFKGEEITTPQTGILVEEEYEPEPAPGEDGSDNV